MSLNQLSLPVLYYGSDAPLPVEQKLQAGPLELRFEGGDLRHIKFGDREILRRVYVAVRDQNWATVPPQLSNLQSQVEANSFRVTFEVAHERDEIGFYWKGTIEGRAPGIITYTIAGEARTSFLRNRIGICVLHPIKECAGEICRVDHVDGTTTHGVFPRFIAPHQPFKNIRSVSHQAGAGVWARVEFEGDVFEMEDQRNWTDASFKIYSTPLEQAFPVEIKRGTKILQKITLTLEGELPVTTTSHRRSATDNLSLTIGKPLPVSVPRIGLAVANHNQPLNKKELENLKRLNLAHLRVDLKLAETGYEMVLQRAWTEAERLGVELEVALIVSDLAATELPQLVSVLEKLKPQVRRWLIFHAEETSTSAKWVEVARKYLTAIYPAAKIGAGSNTYFTEVNRRRPPIELLDVLCYSVNPQVHAFDNTSLIENLAGQAATIESARRFAPHLEVAVTPVTFKPRFNSHQPESLTGELPAAVDVRQMALFGAAWTLGSLKHLGESGAASVTYFETTGWQGVMERAIESPLAPSLASATASSQLSSSSEVSKKFHVLKGMVFPLYHVLADVGEFAGGEMIQTISSDSLRLDGLAISKNQRTRVVLANMRCEPQHVTVHNLVGVVQTKHMDATNVVEAMVNPESFRKQIGRLRETAAHRLELDLPAYGVIRIDMVDDLRD